MKTEENLMDGVLFTSTNAFNEITLTFVKHENMADGYGISRTLHTNCYTPSVKQTFLTHARTLL